MTVLVVADVADGDPEAAARLAVLRRVFAEHGVPHEISVVRGSDAAREAALVAAEQGRAFGWAGPSGGDGAAGGSGGLVCFGDDAVIRSVMDAVVSCSPARDERPAVGVMAAHAACDFVRTFGIPGDRPEFAAERLAGNLTQPLDVAKVKYLDHSGVERVGRFVGVAEIGLGAAVVRRARRLPRYLGRSRTFLGFWLTQVSYRIPEVRVRGERREFRGRAHGIVIGNAQWGRGALRLSPRSFPGDGFLDLLIMTGPKSDAFRMLPRMFQGEQVPDPGIQEFRARHIRVECDRPLPVSADGEVLGTTPLSVELLVHAVDLRI